MTATETPHEAGRAAPAPADDYPDAVRMAVAAVAAVGVGFFLCHLPYGRLATVLLSLAGATLAGLSILGLDRRAWLGWLGVGLNLLFAILLVGFPTQLGLSGWWPVRAASEAPAAPEGLTADGWVDAGAAAWEEDGVRVGLTFALVGPDPANTGRGRSEPSLWIGARVTATGSRPVNFAGWDPASANGPVLSTPDGTLIPARRAGKPDRVTVAPGQSAEFLLAFEVPPAGQALRLELPAIPYGGTTPARFQIAPELIARK